MRRISLHSKNGRRALLVALVGVALLALFAAVARPAAAVSNGDYNHGGATCTNCHPPYPPTDDKCTACHTGGFVSSPNSSTSRTCYTCHTPGQDMSTVQTAGGCATGAAGAACHNAPGHVGSATKGCTSCHGKATAFNAPDGSRHHVKDALVSGLITLKLNKTRVLFGTKITASGLVKPIAAGGVKVLLQRKNSSGVWVKITTKTLTGTLANTYKWIYKPLKKGSYRMRASVLATSDTRAARTAYKAFAVK